MNEADMGITDGAMQHGNLYAGDDQLLVKFFRKGRKDRVGTLAAGRPIYKDTDYISIMQPGNKDSIVVRPAGQMDKDRFPQHWAKYQARESQESVNGTPLEEWGGLTSAQLNELKYMNVRSVEQLVNISDTNAQGLMGMQILKQRARRFLEGAESDKLAAENAAQKDLLKSMSARLAELEEAAGKAPKKKTPARRTPAAAKKPVENDKE